MVSIKNGELHRTTGEAADCLLFVYKKRVQVRLLHHLCHTQNTPCIVTDKLDLLISRMAIAHILHTGMTQCFDANGSVINCRNSGQDAAVGSGLRCTGSRFKAVSADLIEDSLTGLIWTRDCSLFEYPIDWEESLVLIEEMNRSGRFNRTDWRLPNRRELRSLIDHGQKNPALPRPNSFVNINSGWYWTSTTVAKNASYAWYVHLEGGRMFYGKKTEYYWVWPVAGTSTVLPPTGERSCNDEGNSSRLVRLVDRNGRSNFDALWPEPRFNTQQGQALDVLTGLIWHVGDIFGQQPLSWQEGLGAARALAQRTGKPWRMPTINELESLVDASEYNPALPAEHPFRNRKQGYWSSTTSGFEKDWAYVLYLDKGAVGVGYKNNKDFYLWPVMSPED